MKGLSIPQRSDITPGNRVIFDKLASILGAVPNFFAAVPWSANALSTYLALENSKSSLNARQREAIHLVVSRVNDCRYCIVAHSQIARMNGFTEEQIKEMLVGTAGFDKELDAMIQLAKSIAENGGACNDDMLNAFYLAGLTKENLVDTV